MASNYRQCLDSIRHTATTHPGLWLDKYMPNHETGSGQALINEATGIHVSEEYKQFYLRWKSALGQTEAVVTRTAKVTGRLSIGLGDESVLETAITLHRTYGIPYIPGSALKGLAANYARNRLDAATWGDKSAAYHILFGDTTSAGYVTFFDALYVPETGHDKKPLWPDVITVHHPDYYQQGNIAPADWDNPTPISFVTATGDYLIAIGGDAAWVQKAFEILTFALAEVGVGAKTSSGYGRLHLEMGATAAATGAAGASAPADAEDPAAAALLQQIRALPIAKVAPEMPQLVDRWRRLSSADAKRLIATAILEKIREAKREKASADKPWYQELLRFAAQE